MQQWRFLLRYGARPESLVPPPRGLQFVAFAVPQRMNDVQGFFEGDEPATMVQFVLVDGAGQFVRRAIARRNCWRTAAVRNLEWDGPARGIDDR